MGRFSTKGISAALLASTVLLAGCGSSSLNPFNWFGKSQSESESVSTNTNTLIPTRSGFRRRDTEYQGRAVDQITGLVIERVPGGAIVRVNGVAFAQGSYDVVMEPENIDELPVKGVLTYTLKALLPSKYRQQGNTTSREISAAHYVSDQTLNGVRSIRVLGAKNARTARRR